MALQSILGGLWIPRPIPDNIAPGLTFAASMATATSKVAFIFQVPKAGNIAKVVWGTRTVTTGATVDVRLEGVDATVTPATPNGTLIGTNTNGSQSVLSTDDNAVFVTTLTAAAAVTKGQIIALVLANSGSGSMQVPTCVNYPAVAEGFPYNINFNGTSWSTVTGVDCTLSLEYDDGSYVPIAGAYPGTSTITTSTINSGTTPNVAGLRFQVPFPCKVSGGWASISGGGDFKIKLVDTTYNYGTATGLLATVTLDKDIRGATPRNYYFTFDGDITLTKNTNYRLIIEPQTVTSLSIYDLSTTSLAAMDAWEGGRNFHFTSASSPANDAAWTNFNSGTFRQPFIGILVTALDDGVSAGGGATSVPFVGMI